ncbi:inorganic diphosphatase [Spiroplasma endosymbiont of Amphibalanus improvisus]|uniref:inorganic diphosphatase n=1 Tax=Spiroplasma endosymbiont of Amphibalanus improvisus TaxID=3066327 RepID=UPI00313C97F4
MKQNTINMIVEIPKGSSNKYEYDQDTKKIFLDRVLYGANFYPGEYGFIENTLDYDCDPLDVISLITYPTVPGCQIKVRILGTIKMIDNGEPDTKIFGVVDSDPRFNHIQTLEDVPQHLRDEIKNFFLQYKALQKKPVEINGWGNFEDAINEINMCKKLFQDYNTTLKEKGKDEVVKMWKQKKLIK